MLLKYDDGKQYKDYDLLYILKRSYYLLKQIRMLCCNFCLISPFLQ